MKVFRVTSKANIKTVGKSHRFVDLPVRYIGKFYTHRSRKMSALVRLFEQIHMHYLHHSPHQYKWKRSWKYVLNKKRHMEDVF